jgi:GcrA cell cycle regulator
MTWDDAANATLRKLWGEGLSTAKIGAAMGTTKNSVIGQAHRLDLPGRPSPIRQKADTHPGHAAAKERKARDIKTAVQMHEAGHDAREIAAALDCAYDTARAYLREGGVVLSSRRRAPLPAKREAAPRGLVLPTTLGKGTCRWPIGEPRTPGFRYCDAPALLGKPYCAACCQRAYVPAQISGLAMMPRRWAA